MAPGRPSRNSQKSGATTPSQKLSARLSIAARQTPASSSSLVSRPTIIATASRPAARPFDPSASATAWTWACRLRWASKVLARTAVSSSARQMRQEDVAQARDDEADEQAHRDQQQHEDDALRALLDGRIVLRIPRPIGPCYEPADPGHGMTERAIESVRIADGRFEGTSNEGETGEHGTLPIIFPITEATVLKPIVHGGDLGEVMRRFPNAPQAVARPLDRHQPRAISGRRPGRGGVGAAAVARRGTGAAGRGGEALRRTRSSDDRSRRRERRP